MGLQLTHYTNSANTVSKILKNGLAWVPNKRNLISTFLSHHDFSKREPQEFGMVSFTELPVHKAEKHRDKFGGYGIVMEPEWVRGNNAQKVIYVDSKGPVHDAMSALFNIGYIDLKARIKYPNDGAWQMSYTNKNMAAVAGAQLWVSLLQLYEYIEPISNSYQQEWRIVQKDPLYGYKETKKEIINNVSPPEGWAAEMNVIRIKPNDVTGFVCPNHNKDSLVKELPPSYSEHTIETY